MSDRIEIEDCLDEPTKAALEALIGDREFCAAMDTLGSEIIDAVGTFVEQHGHLLARHLTTGDQGEYTLALVLGWVLGYGAGDFQTEQPRNMAVARLLLACALGAATSADITTTMQQREVH